MRKMAILARGSAADGRFRGGRGISASVFPTEPHRLTGLILFQSAEMLGSIAWAAWFNRSRSSCSSAI